jgi:RNA-directed DNA polymerase
VNEAAPEKKVERLEVDLWAGRRKRTETQAGGANVPAGEIKSNPENPPTMEAVVERQNLLRALAAVERNAGAAGVDGISTRQLREQLRRHWAQTKASLLAGRYQPLPVRRVDIPKPGGGTRMLGIPTVMDRLIQQAIHQVLSPIWERSFSESSYGFRPGRGTRQAVQAVQQHVRSGKRWVVDMDLEKFFDRANHDVLMARVAPGSRPATAGPDPALPAKRRAGGRTDGSASGRHAARRALSPLLSNILLDDLDKELEARGHTFCRYADDCNIYVRSKRAGERVMASVSRFLGERLRLKVNESKSAVERPWKRKFLGYSLTSHREARLKVAAESVRRMRDKVRERFRAGRGGISEDLSGKTSTRCCAAGPTTLAWRKSRECSRNWTAGYGGNSGACNGGKESGLGRATSDCGNWGSRKNTRGKARGTDVGRGGTPAPRTLNAAYPAGYYQRLGLITLLVQVQRFSKPASL